MINDIKLLAQATVEPRISHFLTKDQRLASKVRLLSEAHVQLRATLLVLNTAQADVLGQLDFPE